MSNYVGIDLGTTNSAVCSYDGNETRIWKCPEQNDVTPSAIYIDRRGNKYVGRHAYNAAPRDPDNAAMWFKRYMGTSTPIKLLAANITLRPEECSAEILRVLYGYLPEELRKDPDTGTVITVPAAFNQMQKDATMQAAESAGIGRVALMQEPVAAVMSVMRARNADGTFVIYDLGGGTLDVAVAESFGGRVSLLAHGGIAMCGGRDFDRLLLDNVVKPWLIENFDLPDDLSSNPAYKPLLRLAAWAGERAKIELSARDESIISLSETEARIRDEAGSEIYINITITRGTLDTLMNERINETVEAARETLEKAGLSGHDVERLVFIGGPTNYKPLRDKVSFELGIPASGDVNPMTAVAEGAALFAESIDWGTKTRGRKSNRGKLGSTGPLSVTFNYMSRTPETRAKVIIQVQGEVAAGTEFEINSLDTGWTSGRRELIDGASIDLILPKSGENTFKVFILDSSGGPISLEHDKIVITRTAASVEAIPASHSIGIEVRDKLGGVSSIELLINAGDQLPAKGTKIFKTEESIKAGSDKALRFKLYEGESDSPDENQLIGVMKISGKDFDDGVIPSGADLQCDYQMQDSGNIILEISIPSIGSQFRSERNFYSRQETEIDYSDATAQIAAEAEQASTRLEEIEGVVEHVKLNQARTKLEAASKLDPDNPDPEQAQDAMDQVIKARKLISQVRKENLQQIRQMDLDRILEFFEQYIREFAKPSEVNSFENLTRTAKRSIVNSDKDFENQIEELKRINFEVLWRQDWFVVDKFKHMVSSPHNFTDRRLFAELVEAGRQAMQADDIDSLRNIVAQLSEIQVRSVDDAEMLEAANIIRS